MQLEISFDEAVSLDHIQFLQQQLSALPEVQRVDIEWPKPEPGKMGGGIAAVLMAVLGTKAVSHLVDVLKSYVESSKTQITIKSGRKEVKISSRHPEQAQEFVETILKSIG